MGAWLWKESRAALKSNPSSGGGIKASLNTGGSPGHVPKRVPLGPKLKDQNVKFVIDSGEVKEHFQSTMGDSGDRLATAGYSAPPKGYEAPTREYLDDLSTFMGDGLSGMVTSPTADPGSIDAITTEVAQAKDKPVGYITADPYLEYVNPDGLSPGVDKEKYTAEPKFSYPDSAQYSRATAEVSDSILVTGGRNAAVTDYMNGILKGNEAIVLINDENHEPAWDPKKNRVGDASEYIAKMLEGDTEGIPLDDPFNAKFQTFVKRHDERIHKQTLLVDQKDKVAAPLAARYLKEGDGAIPDPTVSG